MTDITLQSSRKRGAGIYLKFNAWQFHRFEPNLGRGLQRFQWKADSLCERYASMALIIDIERVYMWTWWYDLPLRYQPWVGLLVQGRNPFYKLEYISTGEHLYSSAKQVGSIFHQGNKLQVALWCWMTVSDWQECVHLALILIPRIV